METKYYKDQNNFKFCLEGEGEPNENWTEITEAEFNDPAYLQ